ncbi:acetyl-CoA C-acyltransferase [Thalassobius sp. S69A]|uniref:acetyl-CoA C-acyltransferase n=1 Tax=unclassified Thalassovita TaxID=2619711 RepID=UPI000C0C9C84|nr:acetyl-CoA C-acyltransferase [Paracoccaceae bacterium]MBT27067.1 acetyl-CoA C-acyltransferase [Paracoccaceae bacterium]
MKDAVIVSTARTGLAKSFRGSLNATHGATMGGHVIKHAVARAGVDPAQIEDVILGCGFPEAATGMNIARQSAIRGGLPVGSAAQTVNRFCASGLQAIAMASNAVTLGQAGAVVAGGVESISLVQPVLNKSNLEETWLAKHKPAVYMQMIDTADIVAERYGITRQAQDAFSAESQRRTAAAQQAGLFDAEIVPMDTVMAVKDRETKEVSMQPVTVTRDECNRPSTTLDSLAGLDPVMGPGKFVTAGNASQLSDGASACVVMEADMAAAAGVAPLGALRGFAVAGCEPDEMGIGPVFAIPKLLKQTGLSLEDIDLWELNEAFASQALYCADTLGIDPAKLNVNGGSISVGHPFGMTGARLAGHLLIEGQRRGAKYGVVSMCIAGGMGAAGLFEIFPA